MARVSHIWRGTLIVSKHLKGEEWRPVALCIIGTATASAVVLWFVPPGINAWRSGYLAGLRDAGLVEDDEPGRDHLHIVR